MTQEFWENLVGRKICGGYLLRRLIGTAEHSAVYRTAYGEANADMKLNSADEVPADVPTLNHPHLLELFAKGRGEVDGSRVRFIITEAADENLAAVVASRALSPDEAKEMLGPVLETLAYLHDRGLAHGSIKPSNILAARNSVKLSIDTIRPFSATASAEEDMRALGLTVIEVLTQDRQPSAMATLPQPFKDIVEHSLQTDPALRWKARQASLRLSGVVPPNPTVTAPAATPPLRTPPPEKRAVESRAVDSERKAQPVNKLLPFWALPAAAIVMLLAVVLVLARGTGSSSAPVPPPVVMTSQPTNTNAPVPAPAPNRMVPDRANTNAETHPLPAPAQREPAAKPNPFETAPHSATKPATRLPAKVNASGWFVVVASYSREADAAHEARLLSGRFPQFKPSVFPPSAIDSHYLVIIGSGLSSDGAESLRQRAVSSGFPRDTYIKKYPAPRS